MLHGITGIDSIEACVTAASDDLGIILQLELTNPGGKMFTQNFAEDIAKLAPMLGVYGVQAPGNRPNRIAKIRNIVGNELVIVCCGVGKQGGKFSQVMQSGGNYAIVGRAIYESKDPLKAVSKIINS